MTLKIIKTKKAYLVAMQRFEEIFFAKNGIKESDGADVLSLLIRDYEEKNFVIAAPNPYRSHKIQNGTTRTTNRDLAEILGYKSRVSDLFQNTRKLNLKMIRKLNKKLNIPLETLVKEY